MTIRALVLLACLPLSAGAAGLRDIPDLPHPATIPTGTTQEVGIPLELPVPELDRRPPADVPEAADPAAEQSPDRVFVVDMGGAQASEASVTVSMSEPKGRRRPATAEIERAVADKDPQRLARLFDGDQRAAVGALARIAASVPLERPRVENLLAAAEPLSVERIRDAHGQPPPAGEKQQLFNTSVHDALAARPLTDDIAAAVLASLDRLASRAINDRAALAKKLAERFHARRR